MGTIERVNRLFHSTYYALNCYVQEIRKATKSNRGVNTYMHVPVQARDLPEYLGKKIDFFF